MLYYIPRTGEGKFSQDNELEGRALRSVLKQTRVLIKWPPSVGHTHSADIYVHAVILSELVVLIVGSVQNMLGGDHV